MTIDSNSLMIRPPFNFTGELEKLNRYINKEREITFYDRVESISASTKGGINLISSITGYLKARKRSEAMEERYAIIEDLWRKKLAELQKRLDIKVKEENLRLEMIFEIFKTSIENDLTKLKEKLKEKNGNFEKKYFFKKGFEEIGIRTLKDTKKNMQSIEIFIKGLTETKKYIEDIEIYNEYVENYNKYIKDYNDFINSMI